MAGQAFKKILTKGFTIRSNLDSDDECDTCTLKVGLFSGGDGVNGGHCEGFVGRHQGREVEERKILQVQSRAQRRNRGVRFGIVRSFYFVGIGLCHDAFLHLVSFTKEVTHLLYWMDRLWVCS